RHDLNRNSKVSQIFTVHEDYRLASCSNPWILMVIPKERECTCRGFVSVYRRSSWHVKISNEASADSDDLITLEVDDQFATNDKNSLIGLGHSDVLGATFICLDCSECKAIIGA